MNRFQRFLVESTARLVPDFRRFLREAGGSMQLANGALAQMIQEKRERDRVVNLRRAEMEESWELAGSGPPMLPVIDGRPIAVQEAATDVVLKERLWELELSLEDRGWTRQLATASVEFSRWGIQQLILIGRLYSMKNPLIKRGVSVSASYVFGRGVEITSDDDDVKDAIERFFTRPGNQKELGHSGLVEKHRSLLVDGNVFFVFFADKGSGEVEVRTIDPIEIWDVITDPDDSGTPWFYRRNWSPVKFDASAAQGYQTSERVDEFYPALGYEPSVRPPTIGGKRVNWDSPVYHIKIGGMPKWKFGCPDIYAAIDHARAYRDFLNDWCTITRALARFSWDVEQPGGAQAIGAVSQALGTTLGNGGTSIESNPPPNVASAFVRSPGTKVTPYRTAGATTEPEQGRRILLMVAAAFGLPETFFGDASTGSLATAVSLDRPTELKFLEAQEVWREALQVIISHALSTEATGMKGKLREALKTRVLRFAREALPKKKSGDSVSILVEFPAVLEHDLAQTVTAIVQAATLGGFDLAGTMDLKTLARLVNNEVGNDSFEEMWEAMYPNYVEMVDDGTGQKPEDEPGSVAGGQAHPKLPTPSFGAESARMVKMLAEAVVELQRKGKLKLIA
jgi:hypothetical protein